MQRGAPWKWILKVLKCKNEICRPIQLKELMNNGVIFLVIMFTARIMVIKMSKMAHFLYLLLMTANNKVWAKYLKAPENFFKEWLWLTRFKVTAREILRVETTMQNLRKLCFFVFLFKGWYLRYGSSESNNP